MFNKIITYKQHKIPVSSGEINKARKALTKLLGKKHKKLLKNIVAEVYNYHAQNSKNYLSKTTGRNKMKTTHNLQLALELTQFFSSSDWQKDEAMLINIFPLAIFSLVHNLPESIAENILKAGGLTSSNIIHIKTMKYFQLFEDFNKNLVPIINISSLNNYLKAQFLLCRYQNNLEFAYFILLDKVTGLKEMASVELKTTATQYLTMKFVSLILFRRHHKQNFHKSFKIHKIMEKEWIELFEKGYFAWNASIEELAIIQKLKTLKKNSLSLKNGDYEIHTVTREDGEKYFQIIKLAPDKKDYIDKFIKYDEHKLNLLLETDGFSPEERLNITQVLCGIDYFKLYNLGKSFIENILIPELKDQINIFNILKNQELINFDKDIIDIEFRIKSLDRIVEKQDEKRNLSDLVGIRIICKDITIAKYLHGFICSFLKPKKHEEIRKPKLSGYGSVLHTDYKNALFDLLDVEIQFVGGLQAHIENQYGKGDHLVYSNKVSKDFSLDSDLIYIEGWPIDKDTLGIELSKNEKFLKACFINPEQEMLVSSYPQKKLIKTSRKYFKEEREFQKFKKIVALAKKNCALPIEAQGIFIKIEKDMKNNVYDILYKISRHFDNLEFPGKLGIQINDQNIKVAEFFNEVPAGSIIQINNSKTISTEKLKINVLAAKARYHEKFIR